MYWTAFAIINMNEQDSRPDQPLLLLLLPADKQVCVCSAHDEQS